MIDRQSIFFQSIFRYRLKVDWIPINHQCFDGGKGRGGGVDRKNDCRTFIYYIIYHYYMSLFWFSNNFILVHSFFFSAHSFICPSIIVIYSPGYLFNRYAYTHVCVCIYGRHFYGIFWTFVNCHNIIKTLTSIHRTPKKNDQSNQNKKKIVGSNVGLITSDWSSGWSNH